jgi:hypothetical protein
VEVELDAFGDESGGYVIREGTRNAGNAVFIQRGPYIGIATHTADEEAALQDEELADAVNGMLDERMSQAAAGDQPTATAY